MGNRLTYEEEKELILLKHDCLMKELAYQRENDRRRHDQDLERGRIKSAEIRKAQERQRAYR